MSWEKYFMPSTTAEALALLDENQGKARLIAGGTDLMVQHRASPLKVKALIDIGRIPALKDIGIEGKRIYIGAAATHSQLVNSTLIREKARVLAEAARTVGSPQIRNSGTVGGNVVNAQPAADTAIALVALDARAHIISSGGEKEVPVIETFFGPGVSSIDPSKELLAAFSFPDPGPAEKTSFIRFARREALALPVVNLGLWLCWEAGGKVIKDVRIAVGPMATVPLRAHKAENTLKGTVPDEAVIEKAGRVLAEEVTPRDSFRGSADFKKRLINVALKRAVENTLEGNGGEFHEQL